MPYITAATHGIDGFYEDALRTTKNGRVILYAKRSTDAEVDVNKGALTESFDKVDANKTYENNFYPIAVTSMIEPIGIQTTLRWEQGGNIIDAFKLGIKSGMNSVTNAAAELIKNASGAVAEAVNFTTGGNDGGFVDSQQRKINALMRKYRRKVISAASSYKNYGGSDTSISLPQLEFTFPASDFNGSHMKRCYQLLSYLLPVHTIKTKKQADEDQKNEMQSDSSSSSSSSTSTTSSNSKSEQAAQNILDSTYWMYETPPNNYINPAMGFNTSFLEGTFAVDISGTVVKDLVPTAVTLVQSRARVLSAADYSDKSSKHCMDAFYTNPATLLLMKNCNAKANMPAVIKIYVQFEFAKQITIQDWKQMFFEGVNLTGVNPYRYDGDEDFNQGFETKLMNIDKGSLFDN